MSAACAPDREQYGCVGDKFAVMHSCDLPYKDRVDSWPRLAPRGEWMLTWWLEISLSRICVLWLVIRMSHIPGNETCSAARFTSYWPHYLWMCSLQSRVVRASQTDAFLRSLIDEGLQSTIQWSMKLLSLLAIVWELRSQQKTDADMVTFSHICRKDFCSESLFSQICCTENASYGVWVCYQP